MNTSVKIFSSIFVAVSVLIACTKESEEKPVAVTEQADPAAPAPMPPKMHIKFGTDATYEPFEYVDKDGNIVGFDIDAGKLICEEIQADCTFVNQAWDGIIPALQAKKYDAIFSSMSITPERKEVVDFTHQTSDTPNALVVSEKNTNIMLDDKGLKGKRVGVQHGTVQDFYATKYYKTATVKRYKTIEDAYSDLLAKRIDLVFADAMILSDGFLKSDKSKGFVMHPTMVPNQLDPEVLGEGVGIAVRKGDQELLDKLNQGLDAIINNGKYRALAVQYFGEEGAKNVFPPDFKW